jgi:pilus assembly protein CpaE
VNVNNERTNDPEPMVGAIISTDREFRTRLTEILASEGGIEVDFAVDEPFTAITDFHLRELRRVDPDVAFVDLESDPQVGLKFSEFLLDSSIAGAVVGAGTTESPDLLVQAMQAGILEFLPKPLDPDKVGGVVERLRRKTGKAQAREAPSQLGRLLSVFSPKGGTGATTFAVNLAVTIHQLSRKRTLIVDLDLELGETALLLGKEPQFSSVDLVRNYHRVDEKLLASYIERDESGVELLSAPYQPADVESVDGERIGKILGFLKGHYDYIIADAPKTLSPLTLNAFEASDHLLLVTTPDL